jgi:predicted amidohydrolase
MTNRLRVAAVQMTSTTRVEENLQRACALVTEAKSLGAELIVLPEDFAFLGTESEKLSFAQAVDGPFTAPLRELARAHGIYVLAGSIPERGPDAEHTYNTSVMIGPTGEDVATYRKIHLFDVDLGDGNRFAESAHVTAGREPCVVEVCGFTVGLSICYDLRFPELYRALVAKGARLLTIPAAFTLHTGKDHWEPLVRARAIENQCFVIACGQFGHHFGKRWSWGKSMIVDPWGTTLAVAPERDGVIVATLDGGDQDRVRRELPALLHRRL